MHRTPAFFIQNLFIVAVVTSLIKAENVLSASAYSDPQQIPVTVELVLDHMPEYSISASSGPGFSSAQPDYASGTIDNVIAYRNASACYAQRVRMRMKVSGNPIYPAVSLVLYRSLPGESSDDDLIEIS
jgi:hypothetical protein